MSLNGSTTTAPTHKAHNRSFSGWTQPSLAPLLALRTRRDLNRVNDSFQFSVPIIDTLVTLLSPSWLQRQVNIRLLGLHRRRSQFQCAPHDLPPNRIMSTATIVRYIVASLCLSYSYSLPHRATRVVESSRRRGRRQTISERYLTSTHQQLLLRSISRQRHNEVRARLESVWM